MPTILGANTLSSGYDVANSLRFNDDDSAFLSKTFSGDGTHHDKGTVSVWLKRSELGAEQGIFTAGSSNRHFIRFESSDTLTFRAVTDSFHVQTNQLFRDPSAWYHIVIAYDTSQGTASNRVKMYVNGSQVTSFSQTDYPDQDLDIKLGAAELNCIGKDSEQTNPYYDGYMAEFVYIDGQQLAADQFGEFDSDSPTIWKPKDVSDLTFGTNGFYLDFEDSGTLGNDVSGNNNDFASSGLAAADQSTDTCTNNFATWNSAADNLDVTLSEGNTKVVHGTQLERRPVISTLGVSKGKWYFEWKNETSSTPANIEIGIVNYASPFMQGRYLGQSLQLDADFTTYVGDGNINMSGSTSASGTTYTTELIGVALDMDNTLIYFYKNNTLVNSGGTNFSGMETGSGFIFPSNADRSGSSSYTASVNFGGSSGFAISSAESDANGYGNFEYAPPSGYYAICTKNIADFG